MIEICVNTFIPCEIGEICVGEILLDGKHIPAAVEILQVVTKEKYLEAVTEQGYLSQVKRSINDPNLKFYKVRVLD